MRVCKNGADGKTQYYCNNDNLLVGTHFDNNTPSNKNDDTVVQFYYDTEGSPTSFRVNNSAPYFYVKNLQGDIEKIIEPNGVVKVTYTYDAWGNVTSVTDNTTKSLSTLNLFRYRGYAYDNESGFYYLQSRYYDPQIGRFLNADVFFDTKTGTPLSTNMFTYCENNPIMRSDPTGCSSVASLYLSYSLISALSNALPGIMLSINGSIASIKAAIATSWYIPVCVAAVLVAITGIIYLFNTVRYLVSSASQVISAVKSRVNAKNSILII